MSRVQLSRGVEIVEDFILLDLDGSNLVIGMQRSETLNITKFLY